MKKMEKRIVNFKKRKKKKKNKEDEMELRVKGVKIKGQKDNV